MSLVKTEISPQGIFSKRYALNTNDSETVELDLSAWREKGEFQVDGKRYSVLRGASAGGQFVLASADREIARAHKPSVFHRTIEVDYAGRTLRLQAKSAFSRKFCLYEFHNIIGKVEPVSWYSRRASAKLPLDLPRPVQVFFVWLVIILWERETAAVAAINS